MTSKEYDEFDASDNNRIAQEVIVEALERKLQSRSVRPEPMGKILKRARGAEAARRKKLDDFCAFLDAYEAHEPNESEDDGIKSTLLRIYNARGNSPYDMAMWLLHQSVLEDRGLVHLLPDEERGSIEGDLL